MDKYSKIAYKLLYRFLRENIILDKYINNLITYSDCKYEKGNYANVLKELVYNYGRRIDKLSFKNYLSAYLGLFSYAPTAFYFVDTDEGYHFWNHYVEKWEVYFEENMKKFEK